MAGKIKRMIEKIIDHQSKGNETIASLTKTKLVLKGINPDKFHTDSPDDADIIDKLSVLAKELNINI